MPITIPRGSASSRRDPWLPSHTPASTPNAVDAHGLSASFSSFGISTRSPARDAHHEEADAERDAERRHRVLLDLCGDRAERVFRPVECDVLEVSGFAGHLADKVADLTHDFIRHICSLGHDTILSVHLRRRRGTISPET